MNMLKAFLLLIILAFPSVAVAQDDDFPQRLALAEKMLEIRPAKAQLEAAVDAYIANYMFNAAKEDQDLFRTGILRIMNPKALEKIAVDAYAETFTHEELAVMVEYYSKPEAQSASAKQGTLNSIVSPAIINMLDQALTRMRTGANAR